MRALLDTHSLLWMTNGSSDLSERALELVTDTETRLFVSIASLWEIAIKLSIRKLPLHCSLAEFIQQDVLGNMIEILPIKSSHLETLEFLPWHHRDPFDRMIIAQAMAEDMAVIGSDAAFKAYDIDLLW